MEAHTISLAGYPHRYYVSTADPISSPPIVALHGFGLDARRSFRTLATALRARGISLYALDLLGFGASATPNRVYSLDLYADLVTRFAAAIGPPAPVLLGHSMGGKIAVATTVLSSLRFAGVVLINPGGFSWMAPWLPYLASRRVTALLRRRWIRQHVLPRLPMGRFLARRSVIEQTLRLQRSHAALDLDATGLRARLRTVDGPVGVIWGLADPLLPPRTLDRLRADLPQARVYRLPQAGHLPMWDQPTAVAERIERFMHGSVRTPGPSTQNAG